MPVLTVSDHAGISERSASRLRFVRPITEANNYKHAAPGARVSFVTDSDLVAFRVYWNALVTRLDTFNSTCSVLVDGVEVDTFACPFAADETGESYHRVTVAGGSKTVTLVWPMAAGMDLLSVGVRDNSTMAPATRPSGVIAVAGDSISQGFTAGRTVLSWPYLLAALQGRQLANIANGSAQAQASHGSALAGLGADRVTYMIGFNNFVAGTAPATFQTTVQSWITNARAALPAAKIYLISPLYSTKAAADYGHANELSAYRSAVQAAELAAGDANTFYVDGLSLMTNSSDRLADGIHPNAAGSAEIATALHAVLG